MSYKILLADDSLTVQKIISLTFKDEDIDVETVNNGDQAINRLHYMRPALVMADVSIPGKNGYEICEYVKSHPDLRSTPVILLVHAFEPFDEERARRVGADQFLKKPFQPIRSLISTVMNLIEPGHLQKLEESEEQVIESEFSEEFVHEPGVGRAPAAAEAGPAPAVVDDDSVLELGDMLEQAWGGASQPLAAREAEHQRQGAPAVPAVVEQPGGEGAATGAVFPQRVIDEIVERVVERLAAELRGRIGDEIEARLASALGESHRRPGRAESDSLLELDEF